MWKFLSLLFFCLLSLKGLAQKSQIDTLYLKVSREDLSLYTISSYPKNGRIYIFFTLKGNFITANKVCQGFSFDTYTQIDPDKKACLGISLFDVRSKKESELTTVSQFKNLIRDAAFVRRLAEHSIPIIFLLGDSRDSIFEVYPVRNATDLSTEG